MNATQKRKPGEPKNPIPYNFAQWKRLVDDDDEKSGVSYSH